MKMSNCTSATHALFANAWVNALKLLRGTSIVDSKRLAKINANDVLEQLNEHEERIHKELRDIALAVRQTKKEKLTSSQMALLQRSRNKRQELTLVSRKKKAIHNHIDTLEVSELNEKVLSSVQETAGVLKSMGLDKAVDDMDTAMADMQDSIMDVNSMQETLANGMLAEDDDSNLLQAELDLLMSDDTVLAPLNSVRVNAGRHSQRTTLTEPPAQTNRTGEEVPATQGTLSPVQEEDDADGYMVAT